MAAYGGDLPTFKFLFWRISEKEPNDNFGNKPLHISAKNGHLNIVKFLMNKTRTTKQPKNFDGDLPLHSAASSGQLEVVEFLFPNTSSIEPRNNEQSTPLHLTAKNGNFTVGLKIKKVQAKKTLEISFTKNFLTFAISKIVKNQFLN